MKDEKDPNTKNDTVPKDPEQKDPEQKDPEQKDPEQKEGEDANAELLKQLTDLNKSMQTLAAENKKLRTQLTIGKQLSDDELFGCFDRRSVKK